METSLSKIQCELKSRSELVIPYMFENVYICLHVFKNRIAFIPPLAEAGVFCDDYDKWRDNGRGTGIAFFAEAITIHDKRRIGRSIREIRKNDIPVIVCLEKQEANTANRVK